MEPMILAGKQSRVESVWNFVVGVACVGLIVSLGTAAFYSNVSSEPDQTASCTQIEIDSSTGKATHTNCVQPELCARSIPTLTSCLLSTPTGSLQLRDVEVNYLDSLLLMSPVTASAPFSAYLLIIDGIRAAAWATADPEPPEYELSRYSVEYNAHPGAAICGPYVCDECANFVQSNITVHGTAHIYLIQQRDRHQTFYAGSVVMGNVSYVVSRTSIAYTGLDHITLFDTSAPACPRIRNMPLYLSQHTSPTGVMVLFMDAYIETLSSLYHGNTPIL